MNLDQPISQSAFADLLGVSQASVSAWVRQGRLQPGAIGRAWVQAYCAHLREQAARRCNCGALDEPQWMPPAVADIAPPWSGMVSWLREHGHQGATKTRTRYAASQPPVRQPLEP